MPKFYYETSFVNYLYDKYEFADILATKTLQSLKGNNLYISTVTLWEILLTKNIDRRKGLIILCQHLFEPVLLKSPTEICFDYIIQGYPKLQNFHTGKSQMNISKVWTSLVEDKGSEIEYDFEIFNSVAKQIKILSKDFSKYIDNIIFDTQLNTKDQAWNDFLLEISHFLYRDKPTENSHHEKLRRLSILLAFYFLCIGVDVENTICERFWKKKKVSNDPLVRMSYFIQYYPKFFFGGPIEYISNMIYFQKMHTKNKTNRGTIHDGLHSIYLPFVDVFLTNDLGFKEFKKVSTLDTYQRIYHTSELNFTHTKMEVVYNGR